MPRKIIDCRATPNEVGCTLTITGELGEVLAAATQHAITEHGHTDTPELRDMLRAAIRAEPETVSQPGEFVQLIDFHTERIDDWNHIQDRRHNDIGAAETVRWSLLCADQDHPGHYIAIVEFPDHARAKASSDHPATSAFAAALTDIATAKPTFVNLDVRRAKPY